MIGIGIIGCGGRINQVARRTCREDKRLRVIGVHDINPKSVEFTRGLFAHKEYYAHTDQELKDYDTIDPLVNDPEIDSEARAGRGYVWQWARVRPDAIRLPLRPRARITDYENYEKIIEIVEEQ